MRTWDVCAQGYGVRVLWGFRYVAVLAVTIMSLSLGMRTCVGEGRDCRIEAFEHMRAIAEYEHRNFWSERSGDCWKETFPLSKS